MLGVYFQAKNKTQNRPVQTEHGNAAEAKFRDWLTGTLPKKFGVTSGFVIPDLLAEYPLNHYDVIVYDALESPVLWIDGTSDTSELGRRRAIPARYVRAVYEVKATLTSRHAKQAMEKLASLHAFHKQFVGPFHTAAIFFELPKEHEPRRTLLAQFAPPVNGFIGALVLHCPLNEQASGWITLTPRPQDHELDKLNADLPLVKDVDALNMYLNGAGGAEIAEAGGEMAFMFWDKAWRVSRGYGCGWADEQYYVRLSWSKNVFARFILDVLSLLNGEALSGPEAKKDRLVFGQIFDWLPRKITSAAPGSEEAAPRETPKE